mgnify:CR=1 FL=1
MACVHCEPVAIPRTVSAVPINDVANGILRSFDLQRAVLGDLCWNATAGPQAGIAAGAASASSASASPELTSPILKGGV